MIQTGLIQNAHSDLVTDATYDFYGLRLATCSLDQRFIVFSCHLKANIHQDSNRIKIWQLDENQGTWSVEDDWKVSGKSSLQPLWSAMLNMFYLSTGS